jgi:hypothetical protein
MTERAVCLELSNFSRDFDEVEDGEMIDYKKILSSITNDSEKQEFLKLKDGDLIDLDGYRGTGLYYYDGSSESFIKTSGEYGYFLPCEAFSFVLEHGLEYYQDCGAEFVLLPLKCEITYANSETGGKQTSVKNNEKDEYALCIKGGELDTDYGIVNGVYFQTSLASFY